MANVSRNRPRRHWNFKPSTRIFSLSLRGIMLKDISTPSWTKRLGTLTYCGIIDLSLKMSICVSFGIVKSLINKFLQVINNVWKLCYTYSDCLFYELPVYCYISTRIKDILNNVNSFTILEKNKNNLENFYFHLHFFLFIPCVK